MHNGVDGRGSTGASASPSGKIAGWVFIPQTVTPPDQSRQEASPTWRRPSTVGLPFITGVGLCVRGQAQHEMTHQLPSSTTLSLNGLMPLPAAHRQSPEGLQRGNPAHLKLLSSVSGREEGWRGAVGKVWLFA